MALCMRAAAAAGVKVVVLDRPNPIGGLQIEGGGLEPGLENFCGLYPVPQRHAMTVGELARLYNTTFGIGCELEVIRCEGWQRRQYFEETGLPWVMPSPNMPTPDTAIVYPGLCLLEATNVSEGRGTTRPFELVGAPFVDGRALAAELDSYELAGAAFRPCVFQPTFDKHAGKACGAVQIHVTDRGVFDSYRTGLAVLVAVKKLAPADFAWRKTAYEFRDDVPAIDLLTGKPGARAVVWMPLPPRRTADWTGTKRGALRRSCIPERVGPFADARIGATFSTSSAYNVIPHGRQANGSRAPKGDRVGLFHAGYSRRRLVARPPAGARGRAGGSGPACAHARTGRGGARGASSLRRGEVARAGASL
jgi:hypothetical protein